MRLPEEWKGGGAESVDVLSSPEIMFFWNTSANNQTGTNSVTELQRTGQEPRDVYNMANTTNMKSKVFCL